MRRAATLAAILATGAPAAARVLAVGPGQPYAQPSDAAAAAQDGDTVMIAPGAYFDCAIWRANRLTIAGQPGPDGPGAVLTDRACQGKAAFVIQGDAVTVRGLTFARIRVPDGNGAGIRAEGRDLVVEDSRFTDDQVGILAGGADGNGGGTLRIAGCAFLRGGYDADRRPTHAVLAGQLDRLTITRSRFAEARGGDHVVSDATRTELTDSDLTDAGTAGPLVWARGDTLILRGNTITLTTPADRPGAVLATGAMTTLVVRGNHLTAPDASVPLLRNWSTAGADAADNVTPDNAPAVSDAGARYHQARAWLARQRMAARKLVGSLARSMGVIR